MKLAKRITIAIILFCLVFGALNWMYFKEQFKYYLDPPGRGSELVTSDQMAGRNEDETAQPDMLWIDSLGIVAPIQYVEGTTEEVFQVALQKGIVHYPGTSPPGAPGNAYFFGHSSDFPTAKGDYKTVFALLPKIQHGAEIKVTDRAGNLFRYKVDRQFSVNPDQLDVLHQDAGVKQLTLQTSYPIGTALKRYIVIAYLQE